jgi:hypothetical protein
LPGFYNYFPLLLDTLFANIYDGGYIMENKHNVKLTVSELGSLWTTYGTDSMLNCVLKYFLEKVEDEEIRRVLEQSLQITQKSVSTISDIFVKENIPIPQGFSEKEDVNLHAPRLYSDPFFLFYVKSMTRSTLSALSMALPSIARADIAAFFSELLSSTTKLYNLTREVLLNKGLYVRSPTIPYPQKVDFINEQSYLTGWFGERRPLNAMEITNLWTNSQTNIVGKSLLIGFAQVAKSDEVRQYMERGKKIAAKHIEVFTSILNENDLPLSITYDTGVIDSTTAPFSDKLMMLHTTSLIGAGIGNYGVAISSNIRRDLASHYNRLMAEVGKYAEDGANLLIKNGWLEQPPHAKESKILAKS